MGVSFGGCEERGIIWGSTRERGVHCFPSVCAEEEMDGVVFLVGVAAEVAVDHAADGGCSVCV